MQRRCSRRPLLQASRSARRTRPRTKGSLRIQEELERRARHGGDADCDYADAGADEDEDDTYDEDEDEEPQIALDPSDEAVHDHLAAYCPSGLALTRRTTRTPVGTSACPARCFAFTLTLTRLSKRASSLTSRRRRIGCTRSARAWRVLCFLSLRAEPRPFCRARLPRRHRIANTAATPAARKRLRRSPLKLIETRKRRMRAAQSTLR